MSKAKVLYELVYPAMVWFEEVFKFYQMATVDQIKEFEKLVKDGNEEGALTIVKRTLGL